MTERVGFIGLGVMGAPMARHLVAAGHPVTVHSRSAPPVDALVGDGARRGTTPAFAARTKASPTASTADAITSWLHAFATLSLIHI